jgi:hypothetical protein
MAEARHFVPAAIGFPFESAYLSSPEFID